MNHAPLVGMEVMIIVSDPWDFGTVHGTGPFFGEVLQTGPGHNRPGKLAILFRLKTPLLYQGTSCEYFVASPRHEGEDIQSLGQGKEVSCALTMIPPRQATVLNPFDLSWWRGGIGLIGTLRRK